jgi:hypothetical protein
MPGAAYKHYWVHMFARDTGRWTLATRLVPGERGVAQAAEGVTRRSRAPEQPTAVLVRRGPGGGTPPLLELIQVPAL